MKSEFHHRKTTRLKSFDYNTPGAYFFTICTLDKKCILADIVPANEFGEPSVILTPYGKIADKYINQLNNFYDKISVDYYVIMPNHIHFLFQVSECGPSGTPVPTAQNAVTSRFLSTFKRYCNKEYGKNIWQARSYDHIIRTVDDYNEVAKYILDNPATWLNDDLYCL